MKNRELKDIIAYYRWGLLTAGELVAILEAKLYNGGHGKENSKN